MIHDLFVYNKIIIAEVINKWEDDFGFYTEQIKYFFVFKRGICSKWQKTILQRIYVRKKIFFKCQYGLPTLSQEEYKISFFWCRDLEKSLHSVAVFIWLSLCVFVSPSASTAFH